MASYTSVALAKHATFTGTTADLVEFTGSWDFVEVVNRDGTNTLYFNVNTSTVPTAAADDTYVVLPNGTKTVRIPLVDPNATPGSTAGKQCVRLVGSGGGYSVTGIRTPDAVTTTQAALLADVRARLDETSAAFWTDEELLRWINEATRDIARRAEVLQTTDTVTVVAGTNEYTLPTNVARIYRVNWIPDGSSTEYPLEYQDFNSMDSAGWTWTNAQGYPAVFTLWGYTPSLKIVLYPSPSAAGEIKLWYYKYPTELATDGSALSSLVDIPNGWNDIVVSYCEAMALRKDANPRWEEARTLYENDLAEMMDRSRRWTDQAGAMQSNGSWLPGWLWNPDY